SSRAMSTSLSIIGGPTLADSLGHVKTLAERKPAWLLGYHSKFPFMDNTNLRIVRPTRRRTLQKHDVRAYLRRGRLPPALCGMVSEAEQARQVPHVWTLHGPVLVGSDPAPVRLPGAAEFPAALQRGADAAGADRPHCGGAAAIRARALGPDPALGQGPAEVLLAHQCARGIGKRSGGVPLCHAPTPLPCSR